MLSGKHNGDDLAAARSLERLRPRIAALWQDQTNDDYTLFSARLDHYFPTLFPLLRELYGTHYDFFYHLEQVLLTTTRSFQEREPSLRQLDQQREENPDWFRDHSMVGGVCYVDLFAENLKGIQRHIPYFQELGLTYLHLMPLFRSPEAENDGGYAVSSFREVNPTLGTIEQLKELARELREHGISLVVDLVFNHTSDEHEWVTRALGGDSIYQEYYWMFDDRSVPDQYEPHLREIFPEQAPGSFTFRPDAQKWVWTTFNRFQWDLNYANPAVFTAMLGEMLFLANQGIEILRLDAVPFIWKVMGTNSENQPAAHTIIRALNAAVRIAAPALLFKSEAIVHPRDIASYIDWEECPISYNPTLMVCLWEALATRKVGLLRTSMQARFELPDHCVWINYVRSHDDIGWGFADEDAAQVGINGYDHRHFLNTYYTGMFPGSFAHGLPFNFNPRTLDMRISGTTASLAGLEKAITHQSSDEIEQAISRLLLIQSFVLSAGGIPLFYLGDEIGTVNDYSYEKDAGKKADNRWVHRPFMNWERAEKRTDPQTIEGRLFQGLQHLIQLRKTMPVFNVGKTQWLDTGNEHVLAYVVNNALLCLANFSEHKQFIPNEALPNGWSQASEPVQTLTHLAVATEADGLTIAPLGFVWLYQSGLDVMKAAAEARKSSGADLSG